MEGCLPQCATCLPAANAVPPPQPARSPHGRRRRGHRPTRRVFCSAAPAVRPCENRQRHDISRCSSAGPSTWLGRPSPPPTRSATAMGGVEGQRSPTLAPTLFFGRWDGALLVCIVFLKNYLFYCFFCCFWTPFLARDFPLVNVCLFFVAVGGRVFFNLQSSLPDFC